MKLIVGLGNPGSKYDKTKHNAGFWVIDELIRRSENSAEKNQCQALVTTCTLYGERVMLAKPQTFMNLSGHAVSEIVNYYHDRLDDILVIHDDLDLPVGKLRFKNGGSAGGHNGIKSIIAQLGSQDFDRLSSASVKAAILSTTCFPPLMVKIPKLSTPPFKQPPTPSKSG